MKIRVASLIFALFYVPWSLYLYWLVLVKLGATELMWFLFWFSVPMAFVVAILGKLAEWED